VVDETQDLGPQALKLLRALMPAANNDLFLLVMVISEYTQETVQP